MMQPAFITAWLNHVGEGAPDDLKRMRGLVEWEYADRQPLCADGDGNLEWSVLASEPGQGPSFGEAGLGAVARIACGLREKHRAECRGWQEHHLAVAEVWREEPGDIPLREGGGRTYDQLDVIDGFGDIGSHQR